MDFTNIPLFERLTERMSWLGQRTRVLSQNIANADTPSYQPQDLKPIDFEAEMRKLEPVAPARTNKKHLTGTVAPVGEFDAKKAKKTYETAPVGNSVVIEEQMMKVSDTQMNYNMVVNLYRKHIDLFKTAIGRGGG
ncbi:flagellar basal body rod protein FlgB [Dongia sp.]|jgi:flagellar basal-body rod protein FlgB|uniref:flagellar basal body rod protein FlgB n=1 Tax=Dongia sp. TaxID=1977262 RepID=UPI0035AD97F1